MTACYLTLGDSGALPRCAGAPSQGVANTKKIRLPCQFGDWVKGPMADPASVVVASSDRANKNLSGRGDCPGVSMVDEPIVQASLGFQPRRKS